MLQLGAGAQFVWPDLVGMALLAACGSFPFTEQVPQGSSGGFARMMWGGAVLTQLCAQVYAFDLIDVHIVTAVISSLGLAPVVLGLPGGPAPRSSGRCNSLMCAAGLAGLPARDRDGDRRHQGRLDAKFWTPHAFRFGATFDRLMFMRVLYLCTARSSMPPPKRAMSAPCCMPWLIPTPSPDWPTDTACSRAWLRYWLRWHSA